jgi:spore maturation protein CgeB
MRKLGHHVDLVFIADKKAPDQVTVNILQHTKPDMLFLLSPFYVSNGAVPLDVIEYAKTKSIPIVCYSTLNTQVPFDEMNETWKQFDVFFAQNMSLADYLKDIGVDAHFMPLGFYPDQYYPNHPPRKQNIDISFMGNPQTTVDVKQDKRVQYLQGLKDFDLRVYGKAFRSRGVNAREFKSHEDQRLIYWRSKINLDLPFINSGHEFYQDLYHCKNRLFEVPACGGFLLTGRCSEFEQLFDESMVGYFDDLEDLKAKVQYYLDNAELRAEMAALAYKEAINNHTFEHRFKAMFDIMGV